MNHNRSRFNPQGPREQRAQGQVSQQHREESWDGEGYARKLADLGSVSATELVEIADKTGEYLAKNKGLKMNQIRRFLDETRRIEAEAKGGTINPDRIVLLRPKLAYAAGRDKEVKPLMTVLDPAIKSATQTPANFEKLLRLIEGIVAYHRFYGGTN